MDATATATDLLRTRGETCIAARRRLQAGVFDMPPAMRNALVVLLDDAARAFNAAVGGHRFTMGEEKRFGNMYHLAQSVLSDGDELDPRA